MPAASILIKPSSANCNMDCQYCFYKCLSSNREEYSKGFMNEETLEKLVIHGLEYADHVITFAFQGGEPTLAGLGFFQKLIALQKKHNRKNIKIQNAIQTNGILLNREWASFLAEHHFLVGVSLDGPRKVHDRYRKDASGQGTFDRVMKAIELLKAYHVDFNILTVVTADASERAGYIYKFFRKQGFQYLQFIPCMDEPDRQRQSQAGRETFAVKPEGYGRFLCTLFDLWYEDFKNGAQVDVRMFSNLAQMAAGYPAEECGMNGRCACYFVVEGDGSVYPCDFYCMDPYLLGTVEQPFAELAGSPVANDFIRSSLGQEEKCKNCPYWRYCRGGCRRWREASGQGRPGPNYLCRAYEIFFAHAGERIEGLGRMIGEKYGFYEDFTKE